MKRLIVSEGKHDTSFLNELIQKYHNGWKINTFDIGSKPSESRIPLETKEIRNFKQRYNPYDVLLKSEGGKPNLLKAIPTIIKRQSKDEIKFDFLLDLDNHSFDDIISQINEPLQSSSAGKRVFINACSERRKHTCMTIQEFEVYSGDKVLAKFHLICLRPELETLLNIKKDDGSNEIDEKIGQGLQDERLTEPITNALFG
jgi:hypothetical protein